VSEPDAARERLASTLRAAGDDVDLAEAALLLAAEEYPDLSVRRWLAVLDDLAEAAHPWVGSAAARGRWSDGLSRFLFAELGFQGDVEHYDDPRNSYLNDVIERRTGLPITLSVLYLELARRCQRHAEGVGLPGHFIVRAHEADGAVLLDPFNGGVRLTEAECWARVREQYGDAVPFDPRYLQPVSKREILARMLRNLKGSYLRRGDLPRALRTVETLLVVTPDARLELRDRALLRMRLGDLRGALGDLDGYLAGPVPDEEAELLRGVRTQVDALWGRRN